MEYEVWGMVYVARGMGGEVGGGYEMVGGGGV